MLSLFKDVLTQLLACLVLWRRCLWLLAMRPAGFGLLVQVEEKVVMGKQIFTYSLALLKPPAGVDKQRLTVTVDGVKTLEYVTGPETPTFKFEAGPVGAKVVVSLDYLDAAGNDSANIEKAFEVVDGIPPEMPEGFGELTQVAERTEEDPAPVPDVPPENTDANTDGSQTTESSGGEGT